jgi:hypothetical protein
VTNETFTRECFNYDSAKNTYDTWENVFYSDAKYMWLQQCPIPCEQTIFEAKVSIFHKNSNSEQVVDLGSTKKSFLYFSFGYETFNKEKHSENLMYDTGNFLTQVGGNLGLFLGFSCFSVILTIIECLNKWKQGCQILK